MDKHQNIPELRFHEFKGEWKETRLEKLFSEFQSGFGITSANITEQGDYPVYGGNGLRGYTNTHTHDGFYLLIGRQGALCGNINRSYGKAYISEHAIACQANESSDTEWLAQRLDYYNLNKLSESSAQPGLSVKKLLRFKLIVPSLQEQQKIASFFTAIDQKISQLKQKKTLLEQYKKGVMQKIFSQEIRFRDNNGQEFPKWEKKRLGDIGGFLKGKGISKDDISVSGDTECIRYGELYTTYGETISEIVSRTDERDSQLIFSKKNDVLIPSSGETSIDIATASCVMHSGIAIGGDINVFRGQINGVYLSYYLNSNKRIDIAKLSQGISVIHLYTKELKTLEIDLPASGEQDKIADFLSAIDARITHTQSQIGKTERWKKGLLQKMFL